MGFTIRGAQVSRGLHPHARGHRIFRARRRQCRPCCLWCGSSADGAVHSMNVDYASLEEKILDGSFRAELEAELTVGFRTLLQSGERLPVATHYASQIAEIVAKGAPSPLRPELAY